MQIASSAIEHQPVLATRNVCNFMASKGIDEKSMGGPN